MTYTASSLSGGAGQLQRESQIVGLCSHWVMRFVFQVPSSSGPFKEQLGVQFRGSWLSVATQQNLFCKQFALETRAVTSLMCMVLSASVNVLHPAAGHLKPVVAKSSHKWFVCCGNETCDVLVFALLEVKSACRPAVNLPVSALASSLLPVSCTSVSLRLCPDVIIRAVKVWRPAVLRLAPRST